LPERHNREIIDGGGLTQNQIHFEKSQKDLNPKNWIKWVFSTFQTKLPKIPETQTSVVKKQQTPM